MLARQWHDGLFGPTPQHRVFRLAGDETFRPGDGEGISDTLRRPFTEAEVAYLALAHCIGECLHGFFQRRIDVVAMALVKIDVINSQTLEGSIELSAYLRPRQSFISVAHGAKQLGGQQIAVAWHAC
jgi:hypothetical protein